MLNVIAGQRSSRNPLLVEVLRDYGYVEARGMGVRTKVIPLTRAGGRDPVFEETGDYVKTILGQIQRMSSPNAPPLSSPNALIGDMVLKRHVNFINAPINAPITCREGEIAPNVDSLSEGRPANGKR